MAQTSTPPSDLSALLRQLEAGREQIAATLRKQEEDIAAIKRAMDIAARVGAMIAGNQQESKIPPAPPRPPEGLTEAIRQSVSLMSLLEDEFDVRLVEEYLIRSGFELPQTEPRSRIAMVLQKMLERGEIVRTFEGSGRIPHRYKAVGK